MSTSFLRVSRAFPMVALALALVGCGGSGSSGSGTSTATNYSIGGTVLGLASNASLEISDGSQTITVKANGPFTLSAAVADGTGYSVAPGTPPTGQSCAQLNGVGTISAADVTNILVFCTENVSAATLNGSYDIASLEVDTDTDELYSAVPFNGDGTQGASTVVTDQAGTTFTTSTDDGASYTVTTSDALPVLSQGTNNLGAIVGADGDEFYWAENVVSAGGGPGLALGVKPLQNATISSLAGNWITVSLTGATTPYDSEGTVTINTDGSFLGSQTTLDVTGVANTQAVSGPAGSYTVANGMVGFGVNSGYISANDEFVMLTAATQQPGGASANYPGLTAAIKQGSGLTLASVNGVYSLGSLAFGTATVGDADSITLDLDGAGNFSGSVMENEGGVLTAGTFSGTYTVSGTGVLTFTDSNSNVYTGGVSADGNLVVLATLTGGGSEAPRIFVGFRQ